jgi:hypothetical protein
LSLELHIVSFDIPFPANYGGVVDVFYKIKALHQLGCKIHLHCFEYGRERSLELNKYCETVQYYRRDENKLNFLKKEPYVVVSRANKDLLDVLLKDELPVLIEGLHNCWLINHLKPSNRMVMVRTHNVEHDYYLGLAKVEKNLAKRQYFKWEAAKLEKFEDILSKADLLLAISPNDCNYFNKKYGHTLLLPAFHSSEKITSNEGKGNYALYHGNLAVGENIEASIYLINEVFSKIDYPFIIAGSTPPNELKLLVEKHENISLQANISVEQLDKLIENAQINVLPTFQPTGIKLKLLSALYKGRFCVVNNYMVENTGLEPLCIVADSAEEMKSAIEKTKNIEFTASAIENRTLALNKGFSNLSNAQFLVDQMIPITVSEKA